MNCISVPAEILNGVREDVGECLGLEIDLIEQKSTFFTDLDGESIDVIDLMFRCEKRFGVRLELQNLMSDLQVEADGRLAAESVCQLQGKVPEIDWPARVAAIHTDDPRDILTIDLICEMLVLAIRSSGRNLTGALPTANK